MVGGHVFDEGACELVIANAAVNPAQKNDELHQRRDGERPGVGFEEFEELGHGVPKDTERNEARRRKENEDARKMKTRIAFQREGNASAVGVVEVSPGREPWVSGWQGCEAP